MYEEQYQNPEELLVEQPTEFNQLPLNDGEWTSIYIPVLSDKLLLMNHNDLVHKFQPKYLRDFLEKILRIGKIRRIDFVDRDIPNSSTPVKAAFVHFEYWYDTTTARNLRNKLDTYGQFRQKGYIYKGKRCSFYLQNDTQEPKAAFFDIRINHKPIQESECDRNVHQLYAENLLLEKELVEKNETIDNLLAELENYRKSCVFESIAKPALVRASTMYHRECFDELNYDPLTLNDLAASADAFAAEFAASTELDSAATFDAEVAADLASATQFAATFAAEDAAEIAAEDAAEIAANLADEFASVATYAEDAAEIAANLADEFDSAADFDA
jgi:hypothetical protein